jgi:hypothetical protein
MSFYSRFSLNGSQPYKTTYEYSQNGLEIPGMSWTPDFSLMYLNQPNLIYHGPAMDVAGSDHSHMCNKATKCGYQFWKTPPQPSMVKK